MGPPPRRRSALYHSNCLVNFVIHDYICRYPCRMTTEEQKAIAQLERLFSKEMYKYSIVVVTHGDSFKKKQDRRQQPMTFKEYVQRDMNAGEDSLGPLMKNVNQRAVLFNNFEDDKLERRKMVIQLVELIDEIREKNGQKYDNHLFEKARELKSRYASFRERSNMLYKHILSYFRRGPRRRQCVLL